MTNVVLSTISDDKLWQLYLEHDCNASKLAEHLETSDVTTRRYIRKLMEKGFHLSPGARGVVDAAGLSGREAKGGWLHSYDEDGKKIGATRWAAVDTEAVQNLAEELRQSLEAITPGEYSSVSKAHHNPSDCLLVMDMADVHIGKLSVKSETGYSYSRDAAVDRMLRGTQSLLAKAKGHNVSRVLFVLGNDILHVDNSKSQTTNGTPQDTHGTLHEMYLDAQRAYIAAIECCAAEYTVDLIYCPSNHDKMMGWALSNSIGIWFKNHPNVNSTEYGMSERHRKYYRYEANLIGLSHGDGARESDLYPLMMTEARSHVSETPFRYWYLHHLHHKIRKASGVTSHDREKDHIGLTVVKSGIPSQIGDNVQIEYVRSPSPPDSWHDKNGYTSRQAVECFIHDPHEGQNARFTHWF
jgi:transposase